MGAFSTAIYLSAVAAIVAVVLSPAFLLHGKWALYCNMVGCNVQVDGTYNETFDLVRRVFVENFEKRGEVAASVAVYFRGELVVDLWGVNPLAAQLEGRPWGQSTKIPLRSYGGIGGIAMAMLVDRGLVDVDERVTRYWPGFSKWLGASDVTVDEVLSGRFTLSQVDDSGARGKGGTPWRLTPLRPSGEAQQAFSYAPYIADVVVAAIVPRVDLKRRPLDQFYREEIATKAAVPESLLSLAPAGSAGNVSVPSSEPLGLLVRLLLGNATAAWCGPLPHADLWSAVKLDNTSSPLHLAQHYLAGQGALHPTLRDALRDQVDLPEAYATAKGLARLYSAIASGDAGNPNDIGSVAGHGIFATPEGTDCVSRRRETVPSGFDDFDRNVSRSPCGFSLTSPSEKLFSLRESLDNGRRWMHFAAPGFGGGNFVAASVGHGIALAYTTARGGYLDRDPRGFGILEAVNEVVYWIEIEEFKNELNSRKRGNGVQ
eukprot:Sspe_Gene.66552::Locus_39314_Transcript_1_3_Confidence_0.500_Length_2479::g.66552::m.66552